jgi:hypothetical protein
VVSRKSQGQTLVGHVRDDLSDELVGAHQSLWFMLLWPKLLSAPPSANAWWAKSMTKEPLVRIRGTTRSFEAGSAGGDSGSSEQLMRIRPKNTRDPFDRA